MLNAKLVVIGGAKATEISLNLPTTIGRGRDANLTLPHPLVSRQHCELFEEDGMLHVKDLKSLNGTYVNSQRIETSSILEPDQLLSIGNVTFRAIYSVDDASVAELTANTSNVIEFDEVASSPESDSKLDPEERDVHNRPTVRGNRKPAAQGDLLKTVHAADLGETSDVMEDDFGQPESQAAPQHSILAALQDAGVAANQSAENATISDIRTQLPGKIRPEASGVDGLVVDPDQAPAEKADLSTIELDDQPSDKLESDESALGSFIRKLPR